MLDFSVKAQCKHWDDPGGSSCDEANPGGFFPVVRFHKQLEVLISTFGDYRSSVAITATGMAIGL
jgi:hypothetical protein